MPTNAKWRRDQKRQIVAVLGFLMVLIGGWVFYNQNFATAGYRSLTIETESGSVIAKYNVELAVTPEERAKGLMYRRDGDLKESDGMLFIFPSDEDQSFWMKNTFISLDMIFIDRSWKIVGIIPDVPINNTISRSIGVPSRYVLEVLAGESAKKGIVPGLTVRVSGAPLGEESRAEAR